MMYVDFSNVPDCQDEPNFRLTEHKTVQIRILKYAQMIGWTCVPREEAERQRRFLPHPNLLPEDRAREMMEHQLMTAQIRVHVHDLDLDGILAQAVPEILAQPLKEFGYNLSPKFLQWPVKVFEQS